MSPHLTPVPPSPAEALRAPSADVLDTELARALPHPKCGHGRALPRHGEGRGDRSRRPRSSSRSSAETPILSPLQLKNWVERHPSGHQAFNAALARPLSSLSSARRDPTAPGQPQAFLTAPGQERELHTRKRVARRSPHRSAVRRNFLQSSTAAETATISRNSSSKEPFEIRLS